MAFELVDLELLGNKAAEDLRQTLSHQPEGDLSAALDRLLGKLEFAYGVAARLAHREPTLEGTCAIWAKMVALCDDLAAQLRSLAPKDPAAQADYDRLLDFRNAAERRRELHS